jgi:dienelactone hydrolase
MFEQPRWPREAWIPVAAGLAWFWCAAGFGALLFLLALLPGCLLLASGVSTLLYPGDRRIPQFTALGGVIGAALALPVLLATFWGGALLLLLSAASFVSAGVSSVRQEPHTEDVPTPEPSLGLAAQVAIDDALLATMAIRNRGNENERIERIRREIEQALALFRERGWLDDPASYHETPPPLDTPTLRRERAGRFEFEHLEFASGYEPRAEEPGRERWLLRHANRTAHAWVMRHSAPGPWLVGIHGYEMGSARLDLAAFQANRLHHKHGLNVALPILPLHGPRKSGRRSGAGFLSGDFLDTVHAEAQAMWDIRRLLFWIRAQGGGPIGVQGLSLGGYNTALLAALDGDLACAIAGIPATDFTRLLWLHGPPLQIPYAEHRGLVHADVRDVLSVVSPLALSPLVPKERRYIFAGLGDRLVPAEQVRDLWRRWERPRIVWYPGAHVTFRMHAAVERLLFDAFRESGLIL